MYFMHKILKIIFFFKLILINPRLFFNKFVYKIKYYLAKKSYNKDKFIDDQEKIYKKNGLNRNFGIKNFFDLSNKHSFLDNASSSEHQILLCAISEKQHINNILEIGTYDGSNSFLISKLFPKSRIDTIDLPDDDVTFRKIYGRQDYNKFKKLNETRDKILKENNNINFIQKNSVKLTEESKKYDLIWIDGAHGYPVVTIDIINALRLINRNGIILCDDVWINKPIKQDKIYNSLASFETLEQLEDNNLINFDLFYKRLDVESNSFKYNRKYIAYIKKSYE